MVVMVLLVGALMHSCGGRRRRWNLIFVEVLVVRMDGNYVVKSTAAEV